jgi:aryl-alcohol dehydrogenase-like predicted oxidoreductase
MGENWLAGMGPEPKVEPSRICLGTAGYGTGVGREAAFSVLDAYLAGGGNFLDTAHIYGAWAPDGAGASEKTIGEWLRRSGARDRLIIATKGGHPPMGQMDQCRLSRQDLEQDLSESLQRLGVQHIDLYWLHRDDPAKPVGEILEALAGLVGRGLIRAYGLSNWTVERIEAMQTCARSVGLPPPVASQIEFSLADQGERQHRPGGTEWCDEPTRRWHESMGMPICAFGSQAQGYFGAANAAWAKGGFQGDPPKAGHDSAVNRQRLLRAVALAEQKGCTTNQIALAYLLCQKARVVPIVSTSNVEHLKESLAAPNVHLTPEECRTLTAREA